MSPGSEKNLIFGSRVLDFSSFDQNFLFRTTSVEYGLTTFIKLLLIGKAGQEVKKLGIKYVRNMIPVAVIN